MSEREQAVQLLRVPAELPIKTGSEHRILAARIPLITFLKIYDRSMSNNML